MSVIIYTLLSLYLCFSLPSKEKSLYIIADKNESSVKYFPKILRYDDGQVADVCFETKDVFLISPFCFKIEPKSSMNKVKLDAIEGAIWHFDDLNDYLIHYFNKEKYSCATMFANYKDVYILIPKDEYHEVAKVVKCHTFEVSTGQSN